MPTRSEALGLTPNDEKETETETETQRHRGGDGGKVWIILPCMLKLTETEAAVTILPILHKEES